METSTAERTAQRRTGAGLAPGRWAALPRELRQVLMAVTGGLLLLMVSVPLGVRMAGADGPTPVPQVMAFLPWMLAPAGLGLLLMGLARWPAGIVWGLAVIVCTGWFIRPYGAVADAPAGPVKAHLRILSANVEFGQATDGLLAQLRAEEPDFVSVQECDVQCAAALRSPAVREAFPYRVITEGSPAEGSALLSRYPLKEEPGVNGLLSMPGATVDVAGTRLRLQVAHPMPPTPESLSVWRTELGRLRDFAAVRGEMPVIIAGDFNASQDHAAFRALIDTGLRDSARQLGSSRTPTWPTRTTPAFGTQIDHVLVSETLQPKALRFLDLENTDHRALLVDIDLH